MNQLTKAEEQLMQFLWEKRKAFTKDLIEAYSDPKPASTTVIIREIKRILSACRERKVFFKTGRRND